MTDLAWDKVVPTIFFSSLTIISGYIGYTLRDLNVNISQLNTQMGAVVERIAVNTKENEILRKGQEEEFKLIYNHEGRIQSLEREK